MTVGDRFVRDDDRDPQGYDRTVFVRFTRSGLVYSYTLGNDGLPLEAGPPLDAAPALVDLARADRKDDFCFLAGSAGVPAEKHDELWRGTRRRLGLKEVTR